MIDIRTFFDYLLGRGQFAPTRHVGHGTVRRVLRENAKRQANKAIPSAERYTRQQDRAAVRKMRKHLRSLRKEAVMKEKRPGGAAAVR